MRKPRYNLAQGAGLGRQPQALAGSTGAASVSVPSNRGVVQRMSKSSLP